MDLAGFPQLCEQVADLVSLLLVSERVTELAHEQLVDVGAIGRAEFLQVVADLFAVERIVLASGSDVRSLRSRYSRNGRCDTKVRLSSLDQSGLPEAAGY